MIGRKPLGRLGLVVALATGASACWFSHDEYQRLLDAARDHATATDATVTDATGDLGNDVQDAQVGMDAPMDVPAAVDAGDARADVFDASTDSGTPFTLGETCSGTVPVVTGRLTFMVDTATLRDDVSEVSSCTGVESVGPDGFFAVDTTAGQHWHIHVHAPAGSQVDPVVYILSSDCIEATCGSIGGVNNCGPGRDEHVSFVAEGGRYMVGIDSASSATGTLTVDVYENDCGDGVAGGHGESCDPSAPDAGTSCTAECRAVVSLPGPTETYPAEIEVNDDAILANEAVYPAGTSRIVIAGGARSPCDVDYYALDVAAGDSIAAEVLGPNETACTASSLPWRLALIERTGLAVRLQGTTPGGSFCPRIGGEPLASSLPAGRYFLRVRPDPSYMPDAFSASDANYTLRISTTH